MIKNIPLVTRTSVPNLKGLKDSDFVDVWFSDEETQRWTIGQLKKVSLDYWNQTNKSRGAKAVLEQFADTFRQIITQKAQEDFDSLPHWHQKNPCLLVNSILKANEVAPHLRSLADSLLKKMPRIVRASQNLRAINIENSSHLFALSNAIDVPWISFDAKQSRNVLLFDIDHDDGQDLVNELPASIRPTLIMDPHSGRSHGVLPLVTPVLIGGKQGPQILADLAHRLLATHLKATALPPGSLIKNPWGTLANVIGTIAKRSPDPASETVWQAWMEANTGLCWHTIQGSSGAELRDIVAALADHFDEVTTPQTKRRFIHRGEPSALGRNCALFDMVRWWAYDENETDGGAIMEKAEEINNGFQEPLPFPEVRTTARSIQRFMTTRYKPKTRLDDRRGVMGLGASGFDQKTKQRLSARRTHDLQTSNTDHKIQQALKHWPETQKLTQAALARSAGLSLRTIKARWKDIKGTQSPDSKRCKMVPYQVIHGGAADMAALETES